jgi:hypothetical protein
MIGVVAVLVLAGEIVITARVFVVVVVVTLVFVRSVLADADIPATFSDSWGFAGQASRAAGLHPGGRQRRRVMRAYQTSGVRQRR